MHTRSFLWYYAYGFIGITLCFLLFGLVLGRQIEGRLGNITLPVSHAPVNCTLSDKSLALLTIDKAGNISYLANDLLYNRHHHYITYMNDSDITLAPPATELTSWLKIIIEMVPQKNIGIYADKDVPWKVINEVRQVVSALNNAQDHTHIYIMVNYCPATNRIASLRVTGSALKGGL